MLYTRRNVHCRLISPTPQFRISLNNVTNEVIRNTLTHQLIITLVGDDIPDVCDICWSIWPIRLQYRGGEYRFEIFYGVLAKSILNVLTNWKHELKLCVYKTQYRIKRYIIWILLQSNINSSWTNCKPRQFQIQIGNEI